MTLASALRSVLEGPHTLPVLFVGSGISKRYLKAPDWSTLLSNFAGPAGRSMPYYRGKARNDLPLVASHIAADFFDRWFTEAAYAASRAIFETRVIDIADPLRFEIAQQLKALRRVKTKGMRRELDALTKLRVHGVITTDWDTLLDEVLPDLKIFVGQQDALFSRTEAIGELYKIHGSVTDPGSMVLRREDYDAYWTVTPS